MNPTAARAVCRPESETPVTAPSGKPARLVRAALLAIVAFGILTAGIAATLHALRLADPPPAIPEAALPAGDPVAHPHCPANTTGRVTNPVELVVADRDLPRFTRVLRQLAYRHGVCYHSIYQHRFHTGHRLTLPGSAISQITTLNSHNYSDLALRRDPILSGSGSTDFRHIDIYVTSSKHDHTLKWFSIATLATTIIGLLASIAAVSNLAKAARPRPTRTPDAKSAGPPTRTG